MKLSFILTIYLLWIASIEATLDNAGLDDWSREDAEKNLNVKGFTASALYKQNIEGKHALEISEGSLIAMGMSRQERQNYREKARAKLEAIKSKPIDVFEWRAANRRLCDFWVVPMVMNPALALLWAKFFDKDDIMEVHNNEIDEITEYSFWASWILVPTRPLYVLSFKFKSRWSAVDDYLSWFLFIQCISEFVGFWLIVSNLSIRTGKSPAYFLGISWAWNATRFLATLFLFYVGYFMVPYLAADLWIYTELYFFMPLSLMGMYAFMYLAAKPHFQKEEKRE